VQNTTQVSRKDALCFIEEVESDCLPVVTHAVGWVCSDLFKLFQWGLYRAGRCNQHRLDYSSTVYQTFGMEIDILLHYRSAYTQDV